MFEMHILLTGLIIFVARICDVSIGTVRPTYSALGGWRSVAKRK